MVNGNPSRRRFLKLGVSGVVVVVVAGVGTYLALQPQPSPAPVATPRPSPTPAPAAPSPPPPRPSAPAATPSPTPVPAAPTPSPTPTPTMVDKASGEGSVMLYNTFDEAMNVALKNGFEKKYPKIKVEYLRGYTELRERALAEGRTGRHINDVWLGNPMYMQPLDEAGFVAEYISPEAATWSSHLKDPKGKWVAHSYAAQTLATYNTERVKKEEVPKSYWDLLKPRWKNVIGYWEISGQPHALVIMRKKIIGEGRWKEWVSGFLDQKPKAYPAYGGFMNAVKIGEIDLGIWTYTGTTTTMMLEQKAPLDYTRTPGTVFSPPSLIWINKYAPHPNAARLLIDYMLSLEGQSLINDMGRYPMMRPGLPGKVGLGAGTGEPIKGEDVVTMWPMTLQEQNAEIEYWKQIEKEKGLR